MGELSRDYHDEISGGELVPLQRAPETVATLEVEQKTVTYEDFGGLDHQIDQLRQVGTIFTHFEMARQMDVQVPTGILLCGPGGVGKTELIKAFAHEIDAELIDVAVSDIQSKWVGESNENLNKLFNSVKNIDKKVVLFFDELDGLFSKDAGGNPGVATALISEMKTLLSQLREHNPNVIVAASTNSLSGFDEALLRPGRFDVVLQIPKPNDTARSSIFGKLIDQRMELYNMGDFTGEENKAGAIDVKSLAAATEGMTGADIKSILHLARSKRLVSFIKEHNPLVITDKDAVSRVIRGLAPICQDDILQAIRQHRQQRVNAVD